MALRRLGIVFFAASSALVAIESPASAAPPWVDRGITLPHYGLSVDAGLALAHAEPGPSITGFGMNLEAAYGITSDVEVGVRTGIRFDENGKALGVDAYGRLFDTETYDTGGSVFANPELHLRVRLLNVHIVELGLEARAYLPFAAHTDFGMMIGVPLALHLGDILRIDTGVFVPVVFSDPAAVVVSLPGRLWIQATRRFWLGPITALRFNEGDGRSHASLLAGFGLGYSFGRYADLKAEFLFPDVTDGPRPFASFGAGLGIGLHFD